MNSFHPTTIASGYLERIVNGVIIHLNRGELIPCDRVGNIEHLSDNVCSHELASASTILTNYHSHLESIGLRRGHTHTLLNSDSGWLIPRGRQ